MTVLEETDDRLILTGVAHRLTGMRWDSGDFATPLRDRAVVIDVTLNGAMLSEPDRLALARWVLAGMPYELLELPESADPSGLSKRELEVVYAMTRNPTNYAVAADLYLSVNTVKTHLRAIYRKLGLPVNNRIMLLRAARERGIIL